MKFTFKTDIGKKRKNNEDSLFTEEYDDCSLFIVADGLGGYESGEVASKIFVEQFSNYIEKNLNILTENVDDITVYNILKEALQTANLKIYEMEKTDKKYKSMATTCVVLFILKEKIYYLSVGDSRLYYINKEKESITQITEDDTYINELLKQDVINEEEAKIHPQRHVLTKAIGIIKNLTADVKKLDKNDGYLLLCSDGITTMMEDNEILDIYKSTKFENIAKELVKFANSKGGNDNITVITVEL